MLLSMICLASIIVTPSPSLVVVNKDESTVSVVDVRTARILATLPTGDGPHEAAASPDGALAAVTDYGGQNAGSTLTVVDLVGLRVRRTIDLGQFRRPHGIAFVHARTVVVTSETAGAVLLVDVTTGVIENTWPTGQAVSHMLAIAGGTLITANIGSGSLSIVPTTGTGEPRALPVAPGTEAVAIRSDGRWAWVGSNTTSRIYAVDLTAGRVVDSVEANGQPYRIVPTHRDGRLLVSCPQADEVLVLDSHTLKLLGRVSTPPGDVEGTRPQGAGRPFGIAVSPDDRMAWVSLRGVGQIAELDLGALTVRRYLPARAGADGLAYADRTP